MSHAGTSARYGTYCERPPRSTAEFGQPQDRRTEIDAPLSALSAGPLAVLDLTDALADRLMSNGMGIVARNDKVRTLTIGKLCDTYRVRPG